MKQKKFIKIVERPNYFRWLISDDELTCKIIIGLPIINLMISFIVTSVFPLTVLWWFFMMKKVYYVEVKQ